MLKYFFTVLLSCVVIFFADAQPTKQAVFLFKTAIQLQSRQMYSQAIAQFKKAIALNNKYDSAYINLSAAYLQINKPDSAIIVLTNATKALPSLAKAYVILGNIYRDNKHNADSAIINYTNAIKIDSSDKEIFYNIAWCNNTKGYYREAIKFALKTLSIDNNYKPAYNELGYAYHQLKAYQECIDQLNKNLALSVNDLPLLYLGYCYIELHQKENALKIAQELNSINPKMAEGLIKKINALQ